MLLTFEDRPSGSPLVERVWRSWSERDGAFSSIAACHWEIVFAHVRGATTVTVRGPETRATNATCPADGEWLGIRFQLGTFMPRIPVRSVLDRRDVELPRASARRFWLDGATWEVPRFEDAEAFVRRLVGRGLVGRDPLVDDVLRDRPQALSMRSAQRRFLRATGLTRGAVRRIERARHATNLLRSGVDIASVAHEAGYFDQAHLTRSLTRLVGRTPGQIVRGEAQLSFLYKTGAA